MVEETSGSETREWTRLLRRAFDIPDIITDVHALLAIRGWIYEELANSGLTDQQKIDASAEIVTAIVHLGQSGALDVLLLRDLAPHLRAMTDAIPDGRVAQAVMSEAFPEPSGQTSDTRDALHRSIEAIVEKVVSYVEQHPYAPGS